MPAVFELAHEYNRMERQILILKLCIISLQQRKYSEEVMDKDLKTCQNRVSDSIIGIPNRRQLGGNM